MTASEPCRPAPSRLPGSRSSSARSRLCAALLRKAARARARARVSRASSTPQSLWHADTPRAQLVGAPVGSDAKYALTVALTSRQAAPGASRHLQAVGQGGHRPQAAKQQRRAGRARRGGRGRARGSLRRAVRIWRCSCARPLARKGGVPHSISYSRMPTLHQSTALPWPLPDTICAAAQGWGRRAPGATRPPSDEARPTWCAP